MEIILALYLIMIAFLLYEIKNAPLLDDELNELNENINNKN